MRQNKEKINLDKHIPVFNSLLAGICFGVLLMFLFTRANDMKSLFVGVAITILAISIGKYLHHVLDLGFKKVVVIGPRKFNKLMKGFE